MKAKFAGRCSHCNGWFAAGSEIVRRAPHLGWEHDQGDGQGCPADPPDDRDIDDGSERYWGDL